MSARHIEQHYGFGAARIPIRAEMHRVSQAGFRADFDAILAEAGSGGPGAIARRFAGTSLGVLGIVGFLGVLIVGLARQEAAREALEVVMLEAAPPILEEALVVPPIMEELPAPPEPIVPEPVVPEPKKPEPPPMVAEVKPEPPPVLPPKIEPARVKPEIAKVEPPPAPKIERIERPVRERPLPVARPRVQIEAVAVAPNREAPVPPSERLARATVRPDARALPRMSAPAAPAIDVPSDAPPERAFRVAAARGPLEARSRKIAGVAPAGISAPADMDMAAERSAPPRGAAVARPTAAPSASRSVPRFEMAAVPDGPTSEAVEAPQVVARAERAAPTPGSSAGSSSARPGLSGVPLGDLQACVTDREEDRLKGAVVAAAKTQGECVSSKGTYRFVETKNVNAFLMWIDRAPSRRVEDRCAELRYALECLQGGSRHASR